MAKRTIQIACDVRDSLPLEALAPMQGELKSLSEEAFKQLKREILTTGFAFPIHIWESPDGKAGICGGHQRLRVLQALKREGYEIPPVPVVKILAKDEREALRRVLQDAAQYGAFDEQGLYEFLHRAEISGDELLRDFKIPEVDLERFNDSYYKSQFEISPDSGAEDRRKQDGICPACGQALNVAASSPCDVDDVAL